ncbi:TPA: hypothetical protein ACOFCL_000786 [Stenotrophomonas maltophilia]
MSMEAVALIVWLLAGYLLVGLRWVKADFNLPGYRQPAYARERNYRVAAKLALGWIVILPMIQLQFRRATGKWSSTVYRPPVVSSLLMAAIPAVVLYALIN